MTYTEFLLIIRFLGGFSVGLASLSYLLLMFCDMPKDTQEFVKAYGLGLGLVLFGVYLLLSALN
jgi:hypothetical protein